MSDGTKLLQGTDGVWVGSCTPGSWRPACAIRLAQPTSTSFLPCLLRSKLILADRQGPPAMSSKAATMNYPKGVNLLYPTSVYYHFVIFCDSPTIMRDA